MDKMRYMYMVRNSKGKYLRPRHDSVEWVSPPYGSIWHWRSKAEPWAKQFDAYVVTLSCTEVPTEPQEEAP